MQKESFFFTAGQFAGLHHLNKRTLHYYDDIGLFSPAHKGRNGYRYYTCRQSADLENILALRELGMSVEELKAYLRHPNTEDFLKIAEEKTKEIDDQIRRLKRLKALLAEKQASLALCRESYDGKVEVVRRPREYLLMTPLPPDDSAMDMEQIMSHLQLAWECNAYKTNCGSYILLDKVRQGRTEVYDGLYTPVDKPKKDVRFQVRPEGEYLCGYCIGSWEKIPSLYRRMLAFAEDNRLELTGYCYETGLNEFAISGEEEYVTRIEIACRGVQTSCHSPEVE